MAISDRITSIEEHIKESYQELEGIGIDTTGVNNNLENIPKLLDGYWETLPKVTGEGTSITLDNTKEGKMKINLKGNTSQETTTQSANLFDEEYYKNTSYDVSGSINYTSLKIKGGRYLVFKSSLKTGKTAVSGLYMFISSVAHSTTGETIYAISNGSAITRSLTFTATDLYLNIIGNIQDVFDNYNVMVATTDTAYVPFVPNSPSPDYPQDIHVVSGDNSIEVKGYNLYNANDTNAVANGYIIQSDGTLKLNEIDNTSGSSPIFKNFVLPITQFKANTTYSFVLEILSVSGSGHITMNESNATTQFSAISSLTSKTFDSLHAGDIIVGTATTKADFTNCTRALSSYCYFLAGEKGSITFRLSIIEGSSVTPQTFTYQPYKSASYPISLGVENLFDSSTATILNGYFDASHTSITSTGTNRTTYCKVQPNTTYYIQKLKSARGFVGTTQTQPAIRTSVSNITNIGYGTYDGTTIDGGTITTGANDNYIVINYTNTNAETGDTPTIILNSIEITKGSTAQRVTDNPIELCKIGTYQDKIDKSSGKNLFDGEIKNIAFGSQGSTNVVLESSTYRGCYISCEAGKTYSVSRINNSNGRFRVMFSSSIPVAQTEIFGGTGNVDTYDSALKIENITAPQNAKYLVIYLSNSSQDIPPIMINEGTTALEYEPYGTGWYVKKEIGKVVLDGSENWFQNGTYPNVYGIDSFLTDATTTETRPMLSDYFTYGGLITNGSGEVQINKFYQWIGMPQRLILGYNSTSLADFKTWLGNNNVEVIYPLKTPTYTEITDSTLLSQLNALAKSYTGQTNISQNNNDLASILNATALSE